MSSMPRPVESAPEDIRDLALEMVERLEPGAGKRSNLEDRLQERFAALMRPGHFSYGGVSRVGRDFLTKYESLFGDRAG